MKKLFILALALFTSSTAFALDDTTLGNVVRLHGDGGRAGNAVRVLKLVRFADREANTASVLSGDAVTLSLVSDDGVSVTRTTTSGDGAFVGISAMTIQTADGDATSVYDDQGRRNWGWVIVYGPANAKSSAGGANGAAAGAPFITSTDSGAITTHRGTDNATAQRAGNDGFYMDAADGSSTSYEVYVTAM